MSAALGTQPRRRIAGPPMIWLTLVAAIGVAAIWPAGHRAPDPAVSVRTLAAETAADGTLTLRDAATGAPVALFPGNADSFVRGAFHALAVRRAVVRAPQAADFRLEALASGRLLLLDPATHSTVELEAFGSTNASQFSHLLGGHR